MQYELGFLDDLYLDFRDMANNTNYIEHFIFGIAIVLTELYAFFTLDFSNLFFFNLAPLALIMYKAYIFKINKNIFLLYINYSLVQMFAIILAFSLFAWRLYLIPYSILMTHLIAQTALLGVLLLSFKHLETFERNQNAV